MVISVGVNTGILAWGAAAAVGVSALLTASMTAHTIVRIAGAPYMIWLGARLLRAAVHDRGKNPPPTGDITATAGTWRSWSRGLLTNLLNPKIGAFYIAILPQFIPTGRRIWRWGYSSLSCTTSRVCCGSRRSSSVPRRSAGGSAGAQPNARSMA